MVAGKWTPSAIPTFVLVFTTLVEARHGIVEVGSVRESGGEGGLHFLVFRFGMRQGGQDAPARGIAGELVGTRQFRTDVPAADAARAFQQGSVFGRIRVFQELAPLRAAHLATQIRAFDVQSGNGGAGDSHQLFAGLYGLGDGFERRRGQGGQDGRRAVAQVRLHSGGEGFGSGFGEVVSAAAMSVHADKARHDVHTLGIDDIGADDGHVAVGYFQYFPVTDQDGAVLQPSLRGKDAAVYDLSQHKNSSI